MGDKEQRVQEEYNRLMDLFSKAPAGQLRLALPLIQNAAFMKATLEDLQAAINAEGVTEEYQNGANQRGMKQSATLQGYNSLIKNYATVQKQLSQLLGETTAPLMPEGNAFTEFCMGHGIKDPFPPDAEQPKRRKAR